MSVREMWPAGRLRATWRERRFCKIDLEHLNVEFANIKSP
jgi:hypothetical protein